MQKYKFIPYLQDQTVLFPENIDRDIAADDPVRLLNGVIEQLDLSGFRSRYSPLGRPAFDPRMLLKVVIYAYMNGIYSCRKMEQALKRDIHFIWLAGYAQPNFSTINRFRDRMKKEVNGLFTQLVLLLHDKGLVTLDVEYTDGTKMESKANRYTFVWRKTVVRNRARLEKRIEALLAKVDEAALQDTEADRESAGFTPEMLTEIADGLRQSLSERPAPKDKEGREALNGKRKQVKELERMRDKLSEYDSRLEALGTRNSMSKTDPDATFMHMKEDAMDNGQTKPGYNLQIGTENQFITDFALFPNPTDTLTLLPFLESFRNRYGHMPSEEIADSGYGSEENYAFMEDCGTEAYVKYNYFHRDLRPSSLNDPFRPENLYYNPDGDYLVCPMGQHMECAGYKVSVTESGYRADSTVYRAARCEGCPLRCGCYQGRQECRETAYNHRLAEYKRRARERLTSEKGLRHRSQRCVEPEAVFGQMKNNMQYKRFRHFGKDKVTMDFAFFAVAFNIKKMAAKMRKRGNGRPDGTPDKPRTAPSGPYRAAGMRFFPEIWETAA